MNTLELTETLREKIREEYPEKTRSHELADMLMQEVKEYLEKQATEGKEGKATPDDKERAIELLKERYPGGDYHFLNDSSEWRDGKDRENEFFVCITSVKGYPYGKSKISWTDAVEDIERQKERLKVDPEKRKEEHKKEYLELNRASEDLTIINCLFKAISETNGTNDFTFGFHEIELIADRIKKADDLLFDYLNGAERSDNDDEEE
jgi:hypothetical protein